MSAALTVPPEPTKPAAQSAWEPSLGQEELSGALAQSVVAAGTKQQRQGTGVSCVANLQNAQLAL